MQKRWNKNEIEILKKHYFTEGSVGVAERLSNRTRGGIFKKAQELKVRGRACVKIDLIGQRFGRLVVIEQVANYTSPHGKQQCKWLCQCDCGGETTVVSNSLRNGGTKSCGCINMERITGSSHHNWKGGVSSERDRIKKTIEYIQWRSDVFERDEYTCQYCNERGGRLHAHHINGFADFPGLRFNIDNGVTLCEKCHMGIITNNPYSFHRLYGTRSCTVEEFNEWMEEMK
ncbi:MAG: HNH endonuclease [Candidatus Peribacteraceae bacterium]|nr:HNH endonuclease [Candidatus Peribacteraceae bacterium]